MNRKLYKAAYNRVLEKKYFYRHMIVFVIGNFIFFFLSLQSWTPAIFYLLTLVWMRVIAIHFANAYPEVTKDFGYRTDSEEEKAIDKEIKKLKKAEKLAKKRKAVQQQKQQELALKPAVIEESSKKYRDADLV